MKMIKNVLLTFIVVFCTAATVNVTWTTPTNSIFVVTNDGPPIILGDTNSFTFFAEVGAQYNVSLFSSNNLFKQFTVIPTADEPIILPCNTQMDKNVLNSGETYNSFSASWINYFASPFVASTNYTACGVGLEFAKIGLPNTDIFVSVYNNNDGKPGNKISDESIISSADLTSNRTFYFFDLFDTPLTQNIKYWIVVRVSNSGDINNRVLWYRTSGADVDVRVILRSNNGTDWSTETTNRQMLYIIYKRSSE